MSRSLLSHIYRGLSIEYRVIRILYHTKVSKIFEKITKIRKYQKRYNLKIYPSRLLVDSKYRPISCITDSNRPISIESKQIVTNTIISAIRESVSYQSPQFRLRLDRYQYVSADIANHDPKIDKLDQTAEAHDGAALQVTVSMYSCYRNSSE